MIYTMTQELVSSEETPFCFEKMTELSPTGSLTVTCVWAETAETPSVSVDATSILDSPILPACTGLEGLGRGPQIGISVVSAITDDKRSLSDIPLLSEDPLWLPFTLIPGFPLAKFSAPFSACEATRPLKAAILPNFKCGFVTPLLILPFVPLLFPTVDPESVVEN